MICPECNKGKLQCTSTDRCTDGSTRRIFRCSHCKTICRTLEVPYQNTAHLKRIKNALQLHESDEHRCSTCGTNLAALERDQELLEFYQSAKLTHPEERDKAAAIKMLRRGWSTSSIAHATGCHSKTVDMEARAERA